MLSKATKDIISQIKNKEDIQKLDINLSFSRINEILDEITLAIEEDSISFEESIDYFKVSKILSSYALEILEAYKQEIEEV